CMEDLKPEKVIETIDEVYKKWKRPCLKLITGGKGI
ncbi:hypothetical protein LCGC14_2708870, partial [marine sediment metagenome]